MSVKFLPDSRIIGYEFGWKVGLKNVLFFCLK